jgi:hypothetical protein
LKKIKPLTDDLSNTCKQTDLAVDVWDNLLYPLQELAQLKDEEWNRPGIFSNLPGSGPNNFHIENRHCVKPQRGHLSTGVLGTPSYGKL